MDSKHGGSPASGIVAPAGLESTTLAPGAELIHEPAVAKENRNAKDRALQFERRRCALSILPDLVTGLDPRSIPEISDQLSDSALALADSLMKKTGGHV